LRSLDVPLTKAGINEKIAKEIKTLAKEELNGRVCLQE